MKAPISASLKFEVIDADGKSVNRAGSEWSELSPGTLQWIEQKIAECLVEITKYPVPPAA